MAEGWPLYECRAGGRWSEPDGLCQVIVARRSPQGRIIAGALMVDLACLGLKNGFVKAFRSVQDYEQRLIVGLSKAVAPRPVQPDLAARIVRAAEQYGRANGFEPHPDAIPVMRLLAGTNPDACTDTIVLGRRTVSRTTSRDQGTIRLSSSPASMPSWGETTTTSPSSWAIPATGRRTPPRRAGRNGAARKLLTMPGEEAVRTRSTRGAARARGRGGPVRACPRLYQLDEHARLFYNHPCPARALARKRFAQDEHRGAEVRRAKYRLHQPGRHAPAISGEPRPGRRDVPSGPLPGRAATARWLPSRTWCGGLMAATTPSP